MDEQVRKEWQLQLNQEFKPIANQCLISVSHSLMLSSLYITCHQQFSCLLSDVQGLLIVLQITQHIKSGAPDQVGMLRMSRLDTST